MSIGALKKKKHGGRRTKRRQRGGSVERVREWTLQRTMWGCNESHSTNLKEAHETGSWLKTKKVGEEEDGWAAVRPSLVQWARPNSAVYFESNGEPLKTFKKVRDIIRSVTRKSHHTDFGEENGMEKDLLLGAKEAGQVTGWEMMVAWTGGAVVVSTSPRTSLPTYRSLDWTAYWWAQPWTPVACKV